MARHVQLSPLTLSTIDCQQPQEPPYERTREGGVGVEHSWRMGEQCQIVHIAKFSLTLRCL